ncbi:MAG TPA: ribonuclease HII [Candidatus Paceibacterota bacterium]|nr:ribonuclease HII [Candidatus Paceibacterota bacterium]
MFKLGIDDAGRGPVIGPMILAGCLMDEETETKLKKLGARDSKQLTQKRREFLEEKIKEKSETFEVIIIPPKIIDGSEKKRIKLNELEAIACAKIINRINKGYKKIKVIIDCPSVSIEKWQDFLKTRIRDLSNLEISCEHKADKNHVCVSAASILAKCVREKEMTRLKEQYGEKIGSGYTSDPLTQKFVGEHAQRYKDNGIFRKTWKNASSKREQKKLGDF